MCMYIFETENRLLHKHLHPYLDQFLNRIKSHFVHDFYLDFQTVKVKTLLQVKNIGREKQTFTDWDYFNCYLWRVLDNPVSTCVGNAVLNNIISTKDYLC